MPTKLGDRLRALRDEKGVTNADLADAAGIDESTVGQILAGEIARPPDERLRGFASALDVSFESLLELIPAGERGEAKAAAATELPRGGLPTEILLVPAGEVRTRPHDGRPAWHNPDAQAVVAATKEMGTDLPIDYDHAIERAHRARQGPGGRLDQGRDRPQRRRLGHDRVDRRGQVRSAALDRPSDRRDAHRRNRLAAAPGHHPRHHPAHCNRRRALPAGRARVGAPPVSWLRGGPAGDEVRCPRTLPRPVAACRRPHLGDTLPIGTAG